MQSCLIKNDSGMYLSQKGQPKMSIDETRQVKIIQVHRDNSDTVNQFLDHGWTLINVYVQDYGEPNTRHETSFFVLAWQSDENPFPKPSE